MPSPIGRSPTSSSPSDQKSGHPADRPRYPERRMEYMQLALQEAEKAGARGDQPVGAVLVAGTDVVVGSNRIASSANPVLHAEVDAILRAVESGLELPGARLFSTVESCYMCMGAILNAGI